MYVLPQSGLGSTTSTAISAGGIAIEGGTVAAAAGAFGVTAAVVASAAIPFIGPAIAGLTLLFSSLFKPNLKKIATTNIVNQVEPGLKQLVASWKALPAAQKTAAAQQQYLQAFLQAWADVVNSCCGSCSAAPASGEGVAAACCTTSQQYGSAGVNCVADRQRGGKWDWWSYYYDPIANDPAVIQNSSVSLASGAAAVVGSDAVSFVEHNPMLAIAGAGLLLLAVAL